MRHVLVTLQAVSLAFVALALSVPVSSATTITFFADLSGPAEFPPNASPGTGTATVIVDDVAFTMSVISSFSGLVSPTTNAHIHCCTDVRFEGAASVATTTPTFPGFPAGVTSGTYSNIFNVLNASTYNPSFLNSATNLGDPQIAFATLLAGMIAGESYFNIHTEAFPGGEIRGFLTPVPIPPAVALFATGLAGLGWFARGRKKQAA